MIQIYTAPKEDKTMPLTFQSYDTLAAWEAVSFLIMWKAQLFYYFHLLSQLKPNKLTETDFFFWALPLMYQAFANPHYAVSSCYEFCTGNNGSFPW